jgi:hypothetical protein
MMRSIWFKTNGLNLARDFVPVAIAGGIEKRRMDAPHSESSPGAIRIRNSAVTIATD